MNKTVKRALLIAGGVVAACGIIWGGLTLARNAQRGNVDVYAVSDFAMTDYWGDTSQTSGMVSTDKMQKIYLSSTQKVSKIYVEEGQTVKKGDKLLSYDTTLTSLDIERAEIDYEKQKLAQKNAEKELNQLMLAQDQEAVDKKVAELQAQIDVLIGKNQQDWYDKNSKPIESVAKLEDGKKAPPLQDPLGDGTVSDGSKAKPYYFNWNTGDALSAENLMKLLPDGESSAYVVLVIRQNNKTLEQVKNCIGLYLVQTTADQPVQPVDPEPTEPTDPTEPTEPTEPVDPVTPVTPVKTLSFYYEALPSIAQQEPDGVDDQVKALQAEINALQQAVAYPKEERTRRIRDKIGRAHV